ncbi:protein NLRC3-like [Dysidea avara]|uniref:protein NLRC3-like n=1 Tax=Dysidea avara TaxID=196820 RepID=UPI00331DD51C
MPPRSHLVSLRQNMRCSSTNLTTEYLAHNTINKNIADIFKPVDDSPSPRVILIDGAPGIGKTYLCREIAYQWSQGKILTDKRFLFFLHAHDPRLQLLKHIKDLVALFCELENEEKIDMIYGHIKETQGEILTIALDGYDEFYGGLQSDHLLSRIIRCEILPKCGVVITSRSFACGSLCGQADRRMEILGFTRNDRQHYIQRALEKNPDDIARLKQYLETHPTVDSLCYIPLNMTILLQLFTENDLPQSCTELYEKFVNLTITLHIEKDEKNKKLLQIGDSFKGSIKQKLACFSYEALRKDVVVFTYEEVSRACPEIMQSSGTIHGFGLLQATQHFTTNGKTLSFNFAHSSVQEYLAAYYIQYLPDDRELDLLRDTFWDKRYLNTWIIYVGLTQANLVQSCGTEELYLSDNQFGDEGAKAFASHLSSDTSLKLLLMNGNNISADVAEEIEQEITTATSLHIVGITSHQLYVRNEPGDHIANILRCYRALKKVSLCNCPVDTEHLEAILNLLVENTKLHTLRLSHIGLTGSMVKLFDTKWSSLKCLSDLTIVEPGLFHIAADDLIHIVPVTSSAKVVTISDIKIRARHSTYWEITKFVKLHLSLMALEIPKCLPKEEKFVDSLVTAIGTAALMQEVDVSHNQLGPIGVQKLAGAIKNIPRLKSLIMRGNDINEILQ